VIRFVEIPLGLGSACACVRCAAQTEREFFSAEVIRVAVGDVIDAWSGGPGPNVLFTGPEPFSHPELPGIVASAAAAGIERIGLRTDAGALSVPGNSEGVLAAGVRHLQVVCLAGTAEAHDALASRPGLFDAAESGLASFLAAAQASHAHVAVTGIVPACSHNLPELPTAVAALTRTGALAVEIAASPGIADTPGFADWVSAAIDTGLVNGVWVSVTGIEPSKTPRSQLHAVTPFSLSVDAS